MTAVSYLWLTIFKKEIKTPLYHFYSDYLIIDTVSGQVRSKAWE